MPSPLDARRLALATLEQILGGKELEDAWQQASRATRTMEARDRAFARQLILTTLRHYGALEALLAPYLKKRPPRRAQLILLMGMAQLLWLETPPHAAVDTSVTLARQTKLAPFAGLINAVLKKIASTAPQLRDASRPMLSLPDWLRAALVEAYGEAETEAVAAAHLQPPPLDLTLRDAGGDWSVSLEAECLPTGTLRRALATDVTTLPGYENGAWWVQDAASALPVRLFSELQGKKSLDLCAAPGGKTLQMAAAGAEVTAVDRSSHRLQRLHENLARTGLTARVVEADARRFAPGQSFERILLDAPCTATGTLRRHPDVALHRSPSDLTELTTLQAELIDHAVTLLTPGGELVYCVCSLLPAEGEAQIAATLRRHTSLKLLPADPSQLGVPADWIRGDMLRILPSYWPESGGLDGFFAARLQKI